MKTFHRAKEIKLNIFQMFSMKFKNNFWLKIHNYNSSIQETFYITHIFAESK